MKKRNNIELDLSFLPESVLQKADKVVGIYNKLNPLKSQAPENIMEFPSKFETLSVVDIRNLHFCYTAWYGYVKDKTNYIAVISNILDTEVQKAYSRALTVQKASQLEIKKAGAKIDREYLEYREYQTLLNSLKERLEHSAETLKDQLMTIRAEIRSLDPNIKDY